jgi:hypothetical protein
LKNYFRNPLCSQYAECLSFAARRDMWLDCSGCPRKHERSLDTDFCGEICLLVRLFREDIYRLIPANHAPQELLDRAHKARKRLFPY